LVKSDENISGAVLAADPTLRGFTAELQSYDPTDPIKPANPPTRTREIQKMKAIRTKEQKAGNSDRKVYCCNIHLESGVTSRAPRWEAVSMSCWRYQ
jgi:hypothetical protein